VRVLSPQSVLFGEPPVRGMVKGALRVEVIPKATADAVIREGHYSGSTCWASSHHFGVYHGGELIGALQYGPLMNPASAGNIVQGSTPEQALELNRMWLSDEKPANTATRAISWSIRLIRLRYPTVEWIQSFADERCGKLGAVYQAASFLYCGEHVGTFYELDGEWFHKSAIDRRDSRGWGIGPKLSRFNRERDRAVEHRFRQFRYIRPLTRRARRNLMLPALPYPKAEREERRNR
jgi:hypothetical protein